MHFFLTSHSSQPLNQHSLDPNLVPCPEWCAFASPHTHVSILRAVCIHLPLSDLSNLTLCSRAPLAIQPQVQRAVEIRTTHALAAAVAPGPAGGLYDWGALDVLHKTMYGTTDISAAALSAELGPEVASIYTSGPTPRDAESR